MTIFIYLLLGLVTLMEGTITSAPIVLVSLVLFAVWRREANVFFPAFILGFLLDIFLVRPVGLTSLFFCLFLLVVMLYQRKYEVRSLFFVLPATMIGAILYSFLFPSPLSVLQIIFATVLSGIAFIICSIVDRREKRQLTY